MQEKISWPFKDLEVGESCVVPVERAKKAKAYIHVYASQAGKRMSWKSSWDGSITVTRLPHAATERYELTPEQMTALKIVFGSAQELKRFAKIAAGPHRIEGLEDGTVVFEARGPSVTT